MDLVSYALVGLNDAKSFLNYSGNDDDMKFLINAVTEFLEQSCGRRFKVTNYIEKYSGNGSNKLVLKQFPITAMTSLQRRTSADNTDSWETINTSDYWYDSDCGLLTKTTVFERGTDNYKATYSAGYETIPYDLQYLAMALIKEFMTQKDSAGIKTESLGDHSITFESILQTNPTLEKIRSNYRKIVLAEY